MVCRSPPNFLFVCLAAAALARPVEAAHFANPAPLFAKPKPPLQGKQPVAIGTIAGRPGKVRAIIFERLKASNAYEITDAEDLKPGDSRASIARMAKAILVKAVVVGRVSDKYHLTLAVYGKDGRLVQEVQIRGGSRAKLEQAVRSQFNRAVGPALAKATGGKNLAEQKAPVEIVEEEEEEELTDEEVEEEEGVAEEGAGDEEEIEEDEEDVEGEGEGEAEDESEPSAPTKAGRTPFELVGAFRGYNRQFAYTDAVTDLLTYKLGFGPALFATARVYPVAFFRDDFLGNFGLIVHGDLGIATSTDYRSPVEGGGETVTKLTTTAQELAFGLIARLPIETWEVDVYGLFGSQTFLVGGDEGGTSGLAPLVPDVKYEYIRVGLEGRATFSKIFVSAHVAPRFLLSHHQIDDPIWFPGATGRGLDFGLMGGYALLPFLHGVVGFDVARYGFDFNSIPKNRPTCAGTTDSGCQKVAGGATDTYISGWLGAMVRLGGTDDAK